SPPAAPASPRPAPASPPAAPASPPPVAPASPPRAHTAPVQQPQQQHQLVGYVPRVIRSYQKEDSEIVDKWHAANTKQRSKEKSMDKAKEKSKDVSDSSATRRLGISVPRTDHDFIRKIGVNDIADLPDCPIKFEYGIDFLPHSMLEGVPG